MSFENEVLGPRYVSVKQLVERYRGLFTESSIRHHIFGAEDRVASDGTVMPGNGLASAIIRIGTRVIIDVPVFDVWVDAHRATGPMEEHHAGVISEYAQQKVATPDVRRRSTSE